MSGPDLFGTDVFCADVRALRALIDASSGSSRPVVLIDGRSGSGKTTIAAELVADWPQAQLVRLDDIYPGWDGLEQAVTAVVHDVLAPVRPRWRAWDWARSTPGLWHPLDPHRPLIVEGVGALSSSSRALATFAVWVDADAATRRHRAIQRDGDAYAPHWERWAAQEDAFIAREHPESLADLVLRTS